MPLSQAAAPKAIQISAEGRYVQYGCSAWSAPKEWVNFDSSLTLTWERLPIVGRYSKNQVRFPKNVLFGDIIKGLPIPDESCRGVYASHVLEHLSLEDFHKALQNSYRILQPGGIFRIIVPDLEWPAREYIARIDRGDPTANSFFLRQTTLGSERKERGVIGFLRRIFNTSEHLWMWDESSLSAALNDHGFVDIRRCHFGDCEDPAFSFVETAGRFEHAVAIEARR